MFQCAVELDRELIFDPLSVVSRIYEYLVFR